MTTIATRDKKLQREILYKYAELGAQIFPCCWPVWDSNDEVHCGAGHLDGNGQPERDNIGKRPLLSGGYHNATQTRAGIDELLQKYPDANFGAHWPNQIALDVDQDNNAFADLARLEKDIGTLPPTLEQISGSEGLHKIYLIPEDTPDIKASTLPGYNLIHVKINGYVIVAGSLHKCGGLYRIKNDVAPIAAPKTLIDLFLNKQGTPEPKHIDAINSGNRHVDLISLIGKLRHDKLSEELIELLAQKANAEADEPLPPEEVTKMRKEYEHQAEPGTVHRNLTDMGNGERLYDKYGDKIRFNYDRKMWLIWNGKCWKWDTGGEIMKFAQKTARIIYNEITIADDEVTAKAKAKWAASSESNQRLSAMIEQAQPLAKITLDELDRDIWLLNCNNGTINLKTGVLQPHKPTDYITRVISTKYNPDATSEEWVKFLKRTFGNKDDLIAFCQRALGYSVTGSQGEQAIFFCFGEGWNGKSTLLGACRLILEEYAAEVEPAAFMVDKNRGTGPNEAIASLYNVNFVTSTEIEEGQRLSTSLLKRMTGGESLRCEHKFERGFNYKPRYKLWMSGNHEPEISDTTKSIKNRFKKVPFLFTISTSERIQHYDEILARQHGEAILAWLVKGCLEWQRVGLGESSEVKEATQLYFDNQDVLHDFLIECCLEQPSATCIKADLYRIYEKWCDDNGDKYALGKKTFNTRIAEKQFISDRGGHNKPIWRGLRILTDDGQNKVTNVNNVTDFTQSSLHEEKGKKDTVNSVTNITKVTLSDVKAPKRLETLDRCPDCGSENIGVWPDGTAGYYCMDCFPNFNQEVE